jgi:predicted DNA-binding protein (MmcQ/YjbR family)
MEAGKLDELAASWPGTEFSEPFGPGTFVWKVGGKMFAVYGSEGVSLKCRDPASAEFLIDLVVAEPAPYLKRGGWVRMRWGSDGIDERLRASYETVRDGLPKRVRQSLG